MLQREPRSSEGCNTSHKGLANVNIRKRMLYRHCYKIKNKFLAVFDPRLSIVKSVFDCRLSSVETKLFVQQKHEKCK